MKTTSKVETVSQNFHYNSTVPQQVTVRGSKKKSKEYNVVRCYIPEKINLDKILLENPPPFKYYKDCFVYILHLITSIVAWKKNADVKRSKGWTPIHKLTLSTKIHGYKPYIDYLYKNKIVDEGSQHIVGVQSRGLKFMSEYISPLKEVFLDKYTLVKKISLGKEKKAEVISKEIPNLSKWFNSNLTIDMNEVKRFLLSEYKSELYLLLAKRYPSTKFNEKKVILKNAFNNKLYLALKILNKQFDLSLDKISGRFYTPITQLKKELKSFIRYAGECIYSVDITNSQPFLSLAILDLEVFNRNNVIDIIESVNPKLVSMNMIKEYGRIPFISMLVKSIEDLQNKEDYLNYKASVLGGRFYEDMIELLLENGHLEDIAPENRRDKVKPIMYATFFSDPKSIKTEYMPQVKLFRKLFPNVYNVFSLIKADTHNTLALLLQKIEAQLVIKETCNEISKDHPNVPLFTIHDSVCTTEANVEMAKEYLTNSINNFMGYTPKFEIKKW